MPRSFGPVIDPFLAGGPPDLGRGEPVNALRRSLAGLSPESLFSDRRIADREAALACLAGLWLWIDCLDESHAVSQEIDTPEGSWWHAIMHRREGDYGNAKYWFRRVGPHHLLPRLAAAAERIVASGCPLEGKPGIAGPGAGWDPFRFVDLCEEIDQRRSPHGQIAREIALEEWRLLFGCCHALAVGDAPGSGSAP